ncbi:MAG: hypothetical protein OEM91_08040 [Hyphomicrobiales bacterium]|nr:hypothetical protein [Hyphomicrobiales bacterium]
MADRKLPKKVKEIIWRGCAHIVTEEEDGMVIELLPLVDGRPDFDIVKSKSCKVKYALGQVISCTDDGCEAGSDGFETCRVCEVEGPPGMVADVCMCCVECPEPN